VNRQQVLKLEPELLPVWCNETGIARALGQISSLALINLFKCIPRVSTYSYP